LPNINVPNISRVAFFSDRAGGESNIGKEFALGESEIFTTAEFSQFLMSNFFDFLQTQPPKNSLNLSAWGGLKSFGRDWETPNPLGKK
jgi:hypothetical protein